MKGRVIRRLLGTALSALAIATAQAQPAPTTTPSRPVARAEQRPNILLILSDDNSVPHDGCHASVNLRANRVTPNLEAFAREGICFERAYTTAPQCAPSRTSIFAGRNPVDIGVTRFAQPARRDVPFFSDLLRGSDYWVGLEGRNHHLTGRSSDPAHVKRAFAASGLSNLKDRFDYVNTFGTKEIDPTTLGERVGQTLDRVPVGKPFFLYFGFNQTHRPFVSDSSWIDRKKLQLPPDWPDLPEVRDDYADYLSDLRRLDQGFGDIMAELSRRGLDKNTIVVFMGDNGDAMYRGKGTLYERGTNVPLIIRWPGQIAPGSRNAALVSGTDLALTFLEVAGVKPDERMSGASLLPLLKGAKSNGRKYIFTERGWHPGGLSLSEGLDYSRAITGERYKLIYNVQPGQQYSPVDQGGRFLADGSGEESKAILPAVWKDEVDRALGAWKAVVRAHQAGKLPDRIDELYFKRPRAIFELYDLEKDPFELDNIAGRADLAPIETELREQLDIWMADNGDYLPFASDAYRETPDPRATP